MTLDGDDLLAVIRRDFPTEYELCALRLQVDQLTRQNQALQGQLVAVQQYGSAPSEPAQFSLPEEGPGRHG